MKTILITGVSSGLGRAMAETALARGHRVVGTLRDEAQLANFEATAIGSAARKEIIEAAEHNVHLFCS